MSTVTATAAVPTLSTDAPAAARFERPSAPPRQAIPAARLVAAADVGAVIAAAALVAAVRVVDRWPHELSGFLSLHIRVQDLALLAGVATAVVAVFAACGL